MTTITTTPTTREEREPAVDSPSIRDAVVGDGLMLSERENRYVIHQLGRGRPELLGSFASAGDALAALDALDDAA